MRRQHAAWTRRSRPCGRGRRASPVHPNGHIYAKMALNLIEKVAGASGPTAAATGGRKRSWSSSNRDDYSPATSVKHRQSDRFGGGNSSDSERSRSESRGSSSSEGGNARTAGNSDRSTNRSADWKMRGGNSGFCQYGRSGPQYYGGGGDGGSSGGRAGGNGGGGSFRGGGGRGGRGPGGTAGFNAGRGGYRY